MPDVPDDDPHAGISGHFTQKCKGGLMRPGGWSFGHAGPALKRTFRTAITSVALAGLLCAVFPLSTSASSFHRKRTSLGTDVAIDSEFAVAGAPCSGDCIGSVHIYARTSSGAWKPQTILRNPAQSKNDFFGSAVAVSGSTVVVGAELADHGGVAYIFARTGRIWRLQATLTNPTPQDTFGDDVAISGNTAIIGDEGHDVVSVTGSAYVYVRSGSTWHMQQKLISPPGAPHGSFGDEVAMSHSTAAISVGDNSNRGAVYVFTRSGGSWHERARLTEPHPALGDNFGDVAVWRTTIVVGAFGVDGGIGRGYVFVQRGRNWVLQDNLHAPHPQQGEAFAGAVAISGNRVIAGESAQVPNICGTAWEFIRSGRTWRYRARVADPHCSNTDSFGAAVAIAGTTALIGAPDRDHGVGAAYVLTVP